MNTILLLLSLCYVYQWTPTDLILVWDGAPQGGEYYDAALILYRDEERILDVTRYYKLTGDSAVYYYPFDFSGHNWTLADAACGAWGDRMDAFEELDYPERRDFREKVYLPMVGMGTWTPGPPPAP